MARKVVRPDGSQAGSQLGRLENSEGHLVRPSEPAHSAAGACVANCRSEGPVGVAPVLGAFEPGARRSALAAGAADVFAIVTGL